MVHPVDNIKEDKITPAYKYDNVNRPRTCTVFKTIDLHVIWGGGGPTVYIIYWWDPCNYMFKKKVAHNLSLII